MKLVTSQLKEGENTLHFDSQQDPWIAEVIRRLGKQGTRVEGPLVLDINLTKLEPDYYLRGKMVFQVQQACARCAETFTLPVTHPFEVALAHVSGAKVRPFALAEESEELDINFFEGPEIDLSPIVEEQLLLSLPYQSFCRPDCKGVCQTCGQNLNGLPGGHSCSRPNPTNPFSVLEGYKLFHTLIMPSN